ncbi:hypothetical protein BH23THE1_BH23THE1_29130 [soil metagenome]
MQIVWMQIVWKKIILCFLKGFDFVEDTQQFSPKFVLK